MKRKQQTAPAERPQLILDRLVVGAEGGPCIVLSLKGDRPSIALFDRAGRRRASLDIDNGDNACLNLFGANGMEQFVLTTDADGGMLSMYGRPGATVVLEPEGLTVNAERRRAALRVADDGPALVLTGQDGEARTSSAVVALEREDPGPEEFFLPRVRLSDRDETAEIEADGLRVKRAGERRAGMFVGLDDGDGPMLRSTK